MHELVERADVTGWPLDSERRRERRPPGSLVGVREGHGYLLPSCVLVLPEQPELCFDCLRFQVPEPALSDSLAARSAAASAWVRTTSSTGSEDAMPAETASTIRSARSHPPISASRGARTTSSTLASESINSELAAGACVLNCSCYCALPVNDRRMNKIADGDSEQRGSANTLPGADV